MAVTITDNRAVRDEADAITGWTGTTTLFTADPAPVEATGELGATVGAALFDAYHTAAAVDLSNHVIYCWVFSRLALGNTLDANGGLMIYVGDASNAGGWKVAGADLAAFRHDSGPTGWQCPALDTANRPASPANRAGSAASVNFAAITRVGTSVNSLAAAPGMNPTYLVDIIRILDVSANNGCALTIAGGTSGDPGTFAQIAAADRLTGNLQAHGILRELAAGAYGCQGPLMFGNPSGSSSSWFQDKNATFVFEARGFRNNLYKIFIADNGVGTTTFILGTKVGSGVSATGTDGVNMIAPSGVGAQFDAATDTDVTDVFIYGSTFSGFTNGILLRVGHEFIGCNVIGCGVVNTGGATMVNTALSGSTVAANTSALIWNVATDPDGFLDGMKYSKGAAAHHAIEFGTSSLTLMTLRGIAATGFNASNNQNDSTLHIKRTTGTVTINLVGCSGNFSYRTDGATVVIVSNPVTTSVVVRDENGDLLADAVILLYAADASGDLPFQESVSLARSGSTVTVTHASHGLATNNYVRITGAAEQGYNGVYQITVTGTNTYTYTIATTPSSPATGSPVATGVLISGTTSVTGALSDTRTLSLNQPVTGWVRKSTASPFYRESSLSGNVVSSLSGLTINVQMIPDE